MRQANSLKLGVSNLAWAPEQTTDALALLARLGVRGVEAAPSRIAAWDRLDTAAVAGYRRRVEDAGLRLCSLQAILFGRPEVQLLADEAAFLAMAEHMRRVAAIAHGLGAGVAVLGAPRNRIRGGMTMAAAEALAAERLHALGDIAEPAGLTIGLEPVPAQYGADFMLLAADVRRVVALCGHPAVRTHLDCACVMLGGGDIGTEVAATGAGLAHYHIAEPELGGFGAPVCAHGEAAAALAAIGYAGWAVIEMREQPSGLAAVERAVRFAQDTYCQTEGAAAELAEMRELRQLPNDDAGQIILEPGPSEQRSARRRNAAREPRGDQTQTPAAERLIAAAELFDEAFYSHAAGIAGSRAELVAHYVATGEAALLSPSPEFDVRFYRDTNPDVAQSGVGPLLHYLQHGRTECRYPNGRLLRRDAERLEASGLFDAQVHAWERGPPALPGLSDAEDYLAARNDRVPIGDMFDSGFYTRVYDDVWGTGAAILVMPVLHYLNVGRAQNRMRNERQLVEYMDVARPRFNERYYLAEFRSHSPGARLPAEPLRHYILSGSRMGLDPAPDFSAEYYMRRHLDLHVSGMAPFYHFAAHGHAEGRVGRPDFSSIIVRGAVAFDNAKPTILVASHEASRTGAPLVGLNVGERLAGTHNVISHLGRSGPLSPEIAAHSCLVATGRLGALEAEFLLRQLKATHRLAAVLMNSVETDVFAPAALQADLPSVALIHEFAEYTLPAGRMSAVVEQVDRVITPAALIRDSVQAELLATLSSVANNVIVRPQGYLPKLPAMEAARDLGCGDIRSLIGAGVGTRVKIVLGAGWVQMRKGVDLFVQTAAALRRLRGDDVRFIWVGDGYHPEADLNYSAWVADMVRRLELERHVFFLPAQDSLDTLFALSDVFFLPSRLDPFPNVALDAFRAGRAVVCFDRATGIAETLRDRPGQKAAAGAAVAYCDVTQAAEALERLLKPVEARRALGNAALAKAEFDFDDYMAVIAGQLDAAVLSRSEAVRAAEVIFDSGLFDASFHDHMPECLAQLQLRAAIRAYVSRGQKGLVRNNPRPGFNEGAARGLLQQPGPALDLGRSPSTHRCVRLGGDARPGVSTDGAHLHAALHLHLHYPELAAEFAARLSRTQMPLDLIVTTTSDARRLEIEYAFRGYKGGSLRYIVTPNRGRDIGPFLTEVGALVGAGEYDVVGHLHGKRSLAVDPALGDRWRTYLLDALLSEEAVLPLFQQDTKLGLVFAEDRHCVGWSKNRDIAVALAARMTPAPTLPEWPIFPIGAMFWARPAALAPLWALGLRAAEFPAEPAPYDGTVLHALERMLPAVCESTGYGWCTVYREGAGW